MFTENEYLSSIVFVKDQNRIEINVLFFSFLPHNKIATNRLLYIVDDLVNIAKCPGLCFEFVTVTSFLLELISNRFCHNDKNRKYLLLSANTDQVYKY